MQPSRRIFVDNDDQNYENGYSLNFNQNSQVDKLEVVKVKSPPLGLKPLDFSLGLIQSEYFTKFS